MAVALENVYRLFIIVPSRFCGFKNQSLPIEDKILQERAKMSRSSGLVGGERLAE